MAVARPRVLILIGAMWPGNDASGPNRSVRGLCETLGDRFEFLLFARSGPPGASPLANSGDWHRAGSASIRYFDVGPAGAKGLVSAIREARPDAILLNSVWDREFTLPVLAARRFGLLPSQTAAISTRGEFSAEALRLKPVRKSAMRALLRAGGFLNNAILLATSPTERSDVAAAFAGMPVRVAPNVRAIPPLLPDRPGGEDGLRAVFLGRISRVKGLDRAIEALRGVSSPVQFDVWGPQEDETYLTECRALAKSLPAHVRLHWRGVATAEQVPGILAQSDVLLMPSHSENFGHAIFEALAAGVPVLTGPSTPWQNLRERHAGDVIPISDTAAWTEAIETLARAFPAERALWRAGARSVAETHVGEGQSAATWAAILEALVRGDIPD